MKREDEAEFEVFVEASGHRLLRTAYLLVGDLHAAEDLLQTALERTARRWTRISGVPEAYARTTIANLATDRWRRRRVRPTEVFTDPPDIVGADFTTDVVVRDALIRALNELTRRQRAVLVLRYFDDLTEPETATALGISVGTVKSCASRALDRLRDIVAVQDTPTLQASTSQASTSQASTSQALPRTKEKVR